MDDRRADQRILLANGGYVIRIRLNFRLAARNSRT